MCKLQDLLNEYNTISSTATRQQKSSLRRQIKSWRNCIFILGNMTPEKQALIERADRVLSS